MLKVVIQQAVRTFTHPWSYGNHHLTTRSITRIWLSDGHHWGVGEAAPLTSHCQDTIEQATQELIAQESWLSRLEVTQQTLKTTLNELTKRITSASANFAVEAALMMLVSQQIEQPMAHVCSWPSAATVPVNLVFGQSIWQHPDNTHLYLPQSLTQHNTPEIFATIKLKVPPWPIDQIAHHLKQMVANLPPGSQLRLDINGLWSLADVERANTALAGLPIAYLEQPLYSTTLTELRTCKEISAFTLALDENIRSVEHLNLLLSADVADVYILKPTVLGGFQACHHAVQQITTSNKNFIFSHLCESAIGRRLCFEVAASFTQLTLPCGLAPASWFDHETEEDGLVQIGQFVHRNPHYPISEQWQRW